MSNEKIENENIDSMTEKAFDDMISLSKQLEYMVDGVRLRKFRMTQEEKLKIIEEVKKMKAVYTSLETMDDMLVKRQEEESR